MENYKKKKARKVTKKNSHKKVLTTKIFSLNLPYIQENKKLTILLICGLLILLLLGGAYLYIKVNVDFAANFADNTLRPAIGSKATISLEASFFNFEDTINQVKYRMNRSTALFPQEQAVFGAATSNAITTTAFQLSPITPLITTDKLPGEGIWTTLAGTDAAVLLAKTVFRPDVERPYAVTNIVKLNMNKLDISAVAGLQQSVGLKKPELGMIPLDVQKSNMLVAAFNGGFLQKDGYYGMIVGKKEYLPLKKGFATFVIFQHTMPEIVKYTGQDFGSDIVAIRQNGPMLIENAKIVTSSKEWNMDTWGLTTTNTMYTWRSGIGITKDGNILYVCGPSLVPETLAKVLLAAGAENAMQLDINPVWVRFVLFHAKGNGQYDSSPLEPSIVNGGSEYLHGYQKDFFYVYKK